MHIVPGGDVDLISPFPVKELAAVIGWTHCYKTIILGDEGPQNDDELYQLLEAHIASHQTWGIVDKNNLTKCTKTDVPLVGIAVFDLTSPYNGYLHVASNRKAWGNKLAQPGLMEQAGHLVIPNIFETNPGVKRISISVEDNNKAAINLAKRIGFKQDGCFKDMIMQKGQSRAAIHLGYLRSEYEQLRQFAKHAVN
jgi:RimJ/RimL family protein N-acetyltransferase